MPYAQIKIDQTAKPAGIAGVAREDLDLGLPVTLAAVGGPFKAYRWTIVDPALNFVTNVKSAITLVSPTNSSTLSTNLDIAGTYLIKLEIDSGKGLGATADDIAQITFYAGPTLATNPQELPQRIPAARETTEHNVPNIPYPLGNPLGWAYTIGRWFFGIVRRLFRVSVRSGMRVSTDGGGIVTVVSQYFMSTSFDGTKYTCTLSPAFLDSTYGVLVTPHESVAWGHPRHWAVTVLSASQFEIRFYDNVDATTAADFSVGAFIGGSN